jgi:hypothetical protein
MLSFHAGHFEDKQGLSTKGFHSVLADIIVKKAMVE